MLLPVLFTVISGATSSIQFGHSLDLLPTERTALMRRKDELGAALEPAPLTLIVRQVELLSRMLAKERMSDGEQKAYLGAYVDILRPPPAFALEKAVSDFITGNTGDRRFMPRVAAVRHLAETYAQPYRDELAKIVRILEYESPQPSSPDERRRVKTGFMKFLDSWPDKRKGYEPPPLEQIKRDLEERGMPPLSKGAQRTVGHSHQI
jgi:hypothetical protein